MEELYSGQTTPDHKGLKQISINAGAIYNSVDNRQGKESVPVHMASMSNAIFPAIDTA